MHSRTEVFFGAFDHEMEFVVPLDRFKTSFLREILFHGDLVVTDNGLYTSKYLKQCIATDHNFTKFVETALLKSALIPAFRYETNGSFEKNLEHLYQGEIQGVPKSAERLCKTLEGWMRGEELRYKVWPSEPISVGFRNLLLASLGGEPPAGASSSFCRIWDDTMPLRRLIIEDTPLDDEGGFRRGGVHNVILHRVSAKPGVVHSFKDILDHCQSDPDYRFMLRFLKWLTYCYQYNQALCLGVDPGLLSLDPVDVEYAGTMRVATTVDIDPPILNQRVPFLSTRALLGIKPEDIFKIRNNGEGEDYFHDLRSWKEHPTPLTAQSLLSSLRRYAGAIVSRSAEDIVQPEYHKRWIIARIPEGPFRKIGELAWDVLVESASIPMIGMTSWVGKAASAALLWLQVNDQNERLADIPIWEPIHLEMRRDMNLLWQTKQATTGDAAFDQATPEWARPKSG